MANAQIATMRGKASYAKILGEPVPNFSKDGFEWKMDLRITKADRKETKALGIDDKVKVKDDYLSGEPFLTFKQRETRPDGGKNDPITVIDILGKPWPQDKLIGNDSTVDVKFSVVDYGPGKKKGMYIRSVRVLDHVPYERQEFAPVDATDEFYKAAQEAQKAYEDQQFKQDFMPNTDLNDNVEDLV